MFIFAFFTAHSMVSGMQTQIVDEEGKDTDHLTVTKGLG